jgi:hypothetical protein
MVRNAVLKIEQPNCPSAAFERLAKVIFWRINATFKRLEKQKVQLG